MNPADRKSMPNVTDFWGDVLQERQALLELLETLTLEQWDATSLCTEWRVRDVVAHMVGETRMTISQTAWGLITSGFRINRYISNDARRRGAIPAANLLEDFRGVVPACTHLPGLSSLAMLNDIVIHQMDIRRALDKPRRIPNRRTIPVAADLWTNRFFPGSKLFRGLRAVATDAAWTAGQGPDVTGPIEALILTLAGRFIALDQLQGKGIATLRIRANAQ
jgi:uncharacterized protein (TIGR03083 family)